MFSPSAKSALPLLDSTTGPQIATKHPVRGHLDHLDPELGLLGWAVRSKTGQPVTLILKFGATEVARCVPDRPRPDVWADGSDSRPAGFLFDLTCLAEVAARLDIAPEARLQVVVEGTPVVRLASSREWSFADLQTLPPFRAGTAHVLGDAEVLSRSELVRLAHVSSRQLAVAPGQPTAKPVGVVECASQIAPDLIVFDGWFNGKMPCVAGALLESPALRCAAGMAISLAPRPDLPPTALAFSGVLVVPEGITVEFFRERARVRLAGARGDWLAVLPECRRIPAEDGLSVIEAQHAKNGHAISARLLDLLSNAMPWNRRAIRNAALRVHLGIDACLHAPGFGVLVSGWLLHPLSHLCNIRARFGAAVFELDPSTLGEAPRGDLAGPFPQFADRVAQAGFSGVLRGSGMPGYHEAWQLRFDFADGSAWLHDISPESVRQVGPQTDWAQIERVCPGFEWAQWLPELSGAVARQSARVASQVLGWQSAASMTAACIVAVSPVTRHQRLALEALATLLRTEAGGAAWGLAVVLPSSMPAGLWDNWLWSHRELIRHRPLCVSRLARDADVWLALPELLDKTGARRFCFIGPDIHPTAALGVQAAQWLGSSDQELKFFRTGVVDGDQDRCVPDAQAFVWNAAAFLEHLRRAPDLLPGVWGTQGLPEAGFLGQGKEVAQVVCHRLTSPGGSPLKDRINTRLLGLGQMSGFLDL